MQFRDPTRFPRSLQSGTANSQYRIKSEREPYQRIIKESALDQAWPASKASRPATCSGDQPCASRSSTAWRSAGSRSSRDPFQRRALVCSLGIGRLVADLAAAVTLHLPRDRRWRAIQSCRDLPDRAAIGLKAGNLASVFQRKLFVPPPRGNTP